MTGALPPGGHPPGTHGGGTQASGNPDDERDFWSRERRRARSSGLVTLDRAVRTEDVFPPDLFFDEQIADEVIVELLARVDGRRTPSRS